MPRRFHRLRFEPLESRRLLSGSPSGSSEGDETEWVSAGDTWPPPSDPLPQSPQAAQAFVRLEPLGSLVYASVANSGSLANSTSQADFTFHAQAGERISAIVRPAGGSSAVLTVALVGTAGSGTAPGVGQPAVLGPTAVAASGTATVRVTGTAAGAFTLDIYRNASLEQQVGDSANGNELSLAGSALALASGTRWAVVGNATQPSTEILVYSENFDGGSHSFTFTNVALATNLWHVTTGRSADGNPNHTPPRSLYFGQGETATGGGNYNTGGTVAGFARSAQVTLLSGSNYTLRFKSLIQVEDDEDPAFDQLEVWIDNGTTQTVVLRRDPGGAGALPGTTGGGWDTFTANLTPFAGQTIAVVFYFNTQDALNNNFEGWYVDDVQIVRTTTPAPEVDEYLLDLTGLGGTSVDVVLKGLEGSFAGATLELLDTNGTTVLAAASTTHSGVPITNYDKGILNFTVPAGGGVYTLRLTTTLTGNYLLLATQSLSFDTEPNQAAGDPKRPIAEGRAGLGHLQLASVQTWSSRAAFLLSNPGLTLEDFEEAVLTSEFATVTGTLQHGTPRPPVFTAADIQPGLRIDANFPNNGSGELVVAAANALGLPNPSKAVGADQFADNTVISFTTSTVFAVGFDVRVLAASPQNVTVSVYGASNQLLATQVVSAGAAGTFFGLTSNVAVARVELISPDGELVDDIVFGAAGVVPDPLGDIYSFSAVMGQVITIETQTPLDDGSSVPGNLLNPRIVVRNPSGTIVASNHNGAPDGKNALVTFTAFVSGTFTVEVLSEAGSGEYLVAVGLNDPPRVTGVYARGPVTAGTWNTAYTTFLSNNGLGNSLGYRISNGANQLATLPWLNVDRLSVTFSEHVNVSSGALLLEGSPQGPPVPGVDAFSYNPDTFTATWTFATPLPANKYVLHFEASDITDMTDLQLDGEWTTSVSTISGTGFTGGDFNFRFNVVPGDVDNSLGVVFAEVGQMRLRIGRTTASGDYNYRQDLDASGGITFSEVAQARLRVGTSISGYSDPANPPAPPPGPDDDGGQSTSGSDAPGVAPAMASGESHSTSPLVHNAPGSGTSLGDDAASGINTAAWDAAVLLTFGEKKKK